MDLGRPAAARAADGLAPPFAATGAAVRLDRRAVEQDLRRRPAGRGQYLKQLKPHAFRRPADEAVVQHLPRTVGRRGVHPSPAGLQDVDDPANPRRSSTRGTPRGLFGNNVASRTHCPSLSQNSSVISSLPQFRSFNQIRGRRSGILFMGPEPRRFLLRFHFERRSQVNLQRRLTCMIERNRRNRLSRA